MKLPFYLEDLNPNHYFDLPYIVVDFETTNIDKGDPSNPDNKLVMSAWKVDDGEIKYCYANEYEQRELVEAIKQVKVLIAHNAKFELGWLERCGVDIDTLLVFDTMLAEYVYLGNRKKSLKLDDVAQRWGVGTKMSLVSRLIAGGVCPSIIPKSWLIRYCIEDVNVTHKLFKLYLRELGELNLLPVVYTRCILTPVLVHIEKRGMVLDPERVQEEYNNHVKELQEVEDELHKYTGGINTNSPKQLAELLYERLGFSELKDRRHNPIRTETGKPKTDTETITRLKARSKSQREFVRLYARKSKLESALSKSLKKFMACCQENDGLLDAQFNQTVTRTHRLSSTGKKYKAQFQNLDNRFKRLFTARTKGWKVGEADGAQLEFRAAAGLAQDERALYDINNDVDVHQFTADTLTEAGQPTERKPAKSHTFKPLYGGSSGTEAEQTYYKAFREKYPQIDEMQRGWINEVLSTKKLKTITGLTFYWPDTRMTTTGYVTNTSSICNYPVQSFATADVIPIAVTYLYHRMRMAKLQSFLVNTVHDSAIAEVHPEEEKEWEQLSHQSFVDDVYNYLDKVYDIQFNAPLDAEVEINTHWEEEEE